MSESPSNSARARAFAQATRHSRRVRWARRSLIWGAVSALLLLVGMSIFDPFHPLPKGITIGNLGLNGTKVTIEKPRLTGFRQDGRAYSVTAASGIQDIKEPNILNLTDVDAHIAMADKSNAEVLAPQGTYDAKNDRMRLGGNIQLRNDVGYDLKMQEAVMSFKAGIFESTQPVVLNSRSGSVRADAMLVTDNGKQISFTGNVQSLMLPEATPATTK